MLTINDLKTGSLILIEGVPYQVLEVAHLHMGRGGALVQTKIKELKTGKVFSRNFKPADTFEEAAVEKRPLKFLYHHRGEFVFQNPKDVKTRFSLPEDIIGGNKKWLKPGIELIALFLSDKPISIQLPVKIDLKVTEAPPGVQGDRSQAGTKTAKLETGALVQVPLFINEGDIVRVNTESGEYVERVKKN